MQAQTTYTIGQQYFAGLTPVAPPEPTKRVLAARKVAKVKRFERELALQVRLEDHNKQHQH